jgi:NAD(P) transhydrogenase
MQINSYDLVVIGSGPAGQKGAICAAKMRKKVAITDRLLTMGESVFTLERFPAKCCVKRCFT